MTQPCSFCALSVVSGKLIAASPGVGQAIVGEKLVFLCDEHMNFIYGMGAQDEFVPVLRGWAWDAAQA